MNYQAEFDQIRESIAKGRTAEALANLKELLAPTHHRDDVLLLCTQHEQIRKQEREGIESPGDIQRSKNRLTRSVLSLLSDLSVEENGTLTDGRDRESLELILNHLDSTFTVYKTQNQKRNYLMKKLRERFDIPRVENYYQIFSDYYDRMNVRELRHHKFIRGTTKQIKANHQACLDLLRQNSRLKKTLPVLADLEAHLLIWISKYDSLFEDDETLTLIYVGVEEQVKFPSKIREILRSYLEN